MWRPLRHCLLLLLGLTTAAAAHADFYVVVHTSQPVRDLSQRDAVDLFMGRHRSLGNTASAQPLDLPKDSPARAAFYRALTGMSLAQINSYWARLTFTGRTTPPLTVTSEAAVSEAIKRNAAAIGYLSTEPADPHMRVVLVVKDAH